MLDDTFPKPLRHANHSSKLDYCLPSDPQITPRVFMEPISLLVKVGISKGLTKLILHGVGADAVTEAVASEIAGAFAKGKSDEVLARLVGRYVEDIEHHPEYRGVPQHDRTAVALEVQESFSLALNPEFLAQHGFNSHRVVSAIYDLRGHKGIPVGFSEHSVALYRTLMDGAVNAVMVIHENTRGWKTIEARHVQARFDELLEAIDSEAAARDIIHQVLDHVKAKLSDLESREYSARQQFLDTYLRAVRNTLDMLELFGLEVNPKTRARHQRLSTTYVTLNLSQSDKRLSGRLLTWPETLDKLNMVANSLLLVRGDAGMGKTTLLRWAAIAATAPKQMGVPPSDVNLSEVSLLDVDPLESKRSKKSISWREKVPFLVVLRDCKDGKFPMPSDFPTQLCEAVDYPPEGFIRWLLEEGKAIVMIDGIDEVPPGYARDSISKAIANLISLYGDKGNIFIITSRPLEADPAFFHDQRFSVADIQPMTDLDRDALIRKWHHAYAVHLEHPSDRAFEAKAELLIDEINTRPAVARLAATPLLCAMLCAQCGILNYTLPGGEAQIIEGLCAALLWRRDKERALPATGTVWDDLEYSHRRDIVSRLANFMVKENQAAIDSDTAEYKIADLLPWIGREKAKAEAEAVIIRERLSERGGLLRVTNAGFLEFVHNTFKEYLAAQVFAQDLEVEFLAENALREDCANVCRFAGSIGSPAYVKRLISAILAKGGGRSTPGLLAVRMTAACPSLDPVLREHVRTIENEMFPPRSHAQVVAIAELGNDAVEKLRYVPTMTVDDQTWCATTLVRIGTLAARAALQAYAQTAEYLPLIEQLSRVLNPLSISYVQESLAPRTRYGLALSPAVARQITDADIKEWLDTLGESIEFTRISFASTRISDVGLENLVHTNVFPRTLTTLNLTSTAVGDAGVRALAGPTGAFPRLTALVLDKTRVGDSGLAALAAPEAALNITKLSLNGTQVTDAGIRRLAAAETGLNNLSALWLNETRVTRIGVAIIRERFPGINLFGVW